MFTPSSSPLLVCKLPPKTLHQTRGFFIPLSPFCIFPTCICWSPLPVWAQPFCHLYPQPRVYYLTHPHNNLGRRCYPLITEESLPEVTQTVVVPALEHRVCWTAVSLSSPAL